MDLYIQGKGKITLNPSDFVGKGGEGTVYVRGDLAYKIYNQRSRMIPAGKFQELAVLDRPNILRPREILLDRQDYPVGYTMRRAPGAVPLCRFFTRAFRDRQGITPETILQLVQKLQDGIAYVHQQGILIVDLHEMNFLAETNRPEVWFIDVDSYQTPGFPATVLMDTIRDRHASHFSPDTDWFSFGIVSFQLFIGIHPYRGAHPTCPDLESRMQRNISVLHKDVTMPHVCYPLKTIPPAYLEWYRAVFEDGKRCPPPSGPQAVIHLAPVVRRSISAVGLRIQELHAFPAEIVLPIFHGSTYAAVTTEGLYVGDRLVVSGARLCVGFTPRGNQPVVARVEHGRLELFHLANGAAIPVDLAAGDVTAADGRLITRHRDELFELEFLELPAGILTAARRLGNVLEQATQVFEGVVVQNLLGAYYVSLMPRAGACCSIHIPELDAYQVLDARYDNSVLMVIATRDGHYDRLVIRFDGSFEAYDLRIVKDVVPAGLNFVVLDSGVCLHPNESEELELFSNRKDSPDIRVIQEPAIAGSRLFKNGVRVYLARDRVLYSLTMQK